MSADLHLVGVNFVLPVGVEPTIPKETDFEPVAYAISATGAHQTWCLTFIVLHLAPGPESNRAHFFSTTDIQKQGTTRLPREHRPQASGGGESCLQHVMITAECPVYSQVSSSWGFRDLRGLEESNPYQRLWRPLSYH